jgi:acyl CoA:acetate/3-ketoacid CoA transferase beta subunit
MSTSQDQDEHRDQSQSPRQPQNLDPLTAATEVVRELKQALAALGISLPSLGVDLASCTVTTSTPRPLVELGRCNLETAQRLAVAFRTATAP